MCGVTTVVELLASGTLAMAVSAAWAAGMMGAQLAASAMRRRLRGDGLREFMVFSTCGQGPRSVHDRLGIGHGIARPEGARGDAVVNVGGARERHDPVAAGRPAAAA